MSAVHDTIAGATACDASAVYREGLRAEIATTSSQGSTACGDSREVTKKVVQKI